MKSTTISIVVVTIIIALGAYWYLSTGTNMEPPLTATASTEGGSQEQFQMLLNELQPISFDTTIFSDPRFMALVDIGTPVMPETLGRLDPFAPVSGVTGK